MRYEEAIKKLGKEWGYDLTDADERKIVAEVGAPVFITHFPREMKAFYMKPDPTDKKVVLVRKVEKGVIPCGIPYVFRRMESVEKDILPDKPLEANNIPIYIIEHPYPVLLGALSILRNQL